MIDAPIAAIERAVIQFAGDVPEWLERSNGSAPVIDSADGIDQDLRENRRYRSCL